MTAASHLGEYLFLGVLVKRRCVIQDRVRRQFPQINIIVVRKMFDNGRIKHRLSHIVPSKVGRRRACEARQIRGSAMAGRSLPLRARFTGLLAFRGLSQSSSRAPRADDRTGSSREREAP
jgi:hypothetical protein